jgi:hypothetical protein
MYRILCKGVTVWLQYCSSNTNAKEPLKIVFFTKTKGRMGPIDLPMISETDGQAPYKMNAFAIAHHSLI